MDDPAFWVRLASPLESYVQAAAFVLGGAWAVYRFGLGREREPALGFDVQHSVEAHGGTARLVSFRVTVGNKSKVKLAATQEMPAFTDEAETLRYAASLLLREIALDGRHRQPITLFDGSGRSPRGDDVELDLLSEYAVKDRSEFWMEPEESYQLSAAVYLNRGTYLAMITFVGTKLPDDFWRRTLIVTVP
jgi:hypothetical protein